jgi:hypothetical protein
MRIPEKIVGRYKDYLQEASSDVWLKRWLIELEAVNGRDLKRLRRKSRSIFRNVGRFALAFGLPLSVLASLACNDTSNYPFEVFRQYDSLAPVYEMVKASMNWIANTSIDAANLKDPFFSFFTFTTASYGEIVAFKTVAKGYKKREKKHDSLESGKNLEVSDIVEKPESFMDYCERINEERKK